MFSLKVKQSWKCERSLSYTCSSTDKRRNTWTTRSLYTNWCEVSFSHRIDFTLFSFIFITFSTNDIFLCEWSGSCYAQSESAGWRWIIQHGNSFFILIQNCSYFSIIIRYGFTKLLRVLWKCLFSNHRLEIVLCAVVRDSWAFHLLNLFITKGLEMFICCWGFGISEKRKLFYSWYDTQHTDAKYMPQIGAILSIIVSIMLSTYT